MKNRIIYLSIAFSLAFLFVGCSTSNAYPIGGGLHKVTSIGAGISAESVTENVYEEANRYAKEKGMAMYPESIDVIDGFYGRNVPSAELTFRLVPHGSIEASTTPEFITGLQKVQIIDDKKSITQKHLLDVSIEDKLKHLKTLYTKELITENEYNKKRKEMLGSY